MTAELPTIETLSLPDNASMRQQSSFRLTINRNWPVVWLVALPLALSAAWSQAVAGEERSPAPAGSSAAITALRAYLAIDAAERPALEQQAFATIPLGRDGIEQARQRLSADRLAQIRRERAAEMQSRTLSLGKLQMPFAYRTFGKRPADGWSLYISLHGGGGTAARVNDQQWENQKRLYALEEGIYVAPRAPTNTWNLWHEPHIDTLLDRLIENFVALEAVNWNRVYVMGYSAGGDGVYQLAPRMADRWAAAAMMAGHPNETSPRGLRNVPFALQVGGRDAAYNRNTIAQQWSEKLSALQKADPEGYAHFVKVYPGKGHWMDREDAVAIPWMAQHTRDPVPKRIVWKQDDVTHRQLYWLGIPDTAEPARREIIASVAGQTITLASDEPGDVIVYLDDRLLDLDQPITIQAGDKVLFAGPAPPRTIQSLATLLERRSDPQLSFPCSVTVSLE